MENFQSSDCWYNAVCDKECQTNGCSKYIQMKWQMEHCGLPKAKQHKIELVAQDCDLDAFKHLASIKSNMDDFVASSNNLIIASHYTGNGKTSWAIKMLQSYLSIMACGNYEKQIGLFIRTASLLLALKDFQNPLPDSYKRAIKEADIVIWDDIAITGISQYDYTQLFDYIDYRILAEKSNIYTSNCETREELSACIGDKLASRIWDRAEVVILKGKDRR